MNLDIQDNNLRFMGKNAKETELAVAFFRDFTRGERLSLLIGAALREEMMTALKADRNPTGYRYPWLKRASDVLIESLIIMAKDFAVRYPGDRISVADLQDLLRLTSDSLGGTKDKIKP